LSSNPSTIRESEDSPSYNERVSSYTQWKNKLMKTIKITESLDTQDSKLPPPHYEEPISIIDFNKRIISRSSDNSSTESKETK
jgi:hypothetical protein